MLGIVRPQLQADSAALFRRDRPRRAEQRLAQPRRGGEALKQARRGQDAVGPQQRARRVDQRPRNGEEKKESGDRDPAPPLPENRSRQRSGEKEKRQLQPGAPGLPLEHQAEEEKARRDKCEEAPQPAGPLERPARAENTDARGEEQNVERITRRIVEES